LIDPNPEVRFLALVRCVKQGDSFNYRLYRYIVVELCDLSILIARNASQVQIWHWISAVVRGFLTFNGFAENVTLLNVYMVCNALNVLGIYLFLTLTIHV
jgi:hypothetical protein